MKEKLAKICYCSFGIGFALAVPAAFLLAINDGILSGFSIANPIIIFLSYLTVIFYLAWMSGAFVCETKDLSCAIRGLLSSFPINIFSVAYFYKDLIAPKSIHALCLIVLLNYLFAIYGCQAGEKYVSKQTEEELGRKGMFFTVALMLPVPFFAISWMVILGVVKLFSL